MAHIIGRVRIKAPRERVFDTVADSRDEPSFNPAITDVELLTPLPIGLGTRFRAQMGKASMEMLVELTEFGLGGRMERRIWTGLKRQLESKGNDRPTGSSQAAFLGGVKHQKELPAAPPRPAGRHG